MPLHPRRVRWFEAHVPREQTVYALEALAAAGSVELEEKGYQTAPCVDPEALRSSLAQFDRLAARYASELPKDPVTPTQILEQPEKLAAGAVSRLRNWCIGLLQLQRSILARERERANLTLLAECLNAMHGASGDIGAMERPSPFLYKNIFSCPKGQLVAPAAEEIFSEVYAGDRHDFWVVAGATEHTAVLEGTAALLDCEAVKLPRWLPTAPPAQQQRVRSRLRVNDPRSGAGAR